MTPTPVHSPAQAQFSGRLVGDASNLLFQTISSDQENTT